MALTSKPARRQALQLLGGLTPRQFLQHYWQKKPLLIRQALPGFGDVLTRDELLCLAGHEDCHARLIWRRGKRWYLKQGPLRPADFAARAVRARAAAARSAAAAPWTVLVQDINHVLPQAEALLRLFRFLPYARLDDLMASYAVPGGGVGPHVDSYDVFLLQGAGKRRWQISHQCALALVPHAPIKLLADFVAEQEWVLEPGDMLYLPPGVAHCGTALSECITYSIGFRAPSNAALQRGLLQFLEDRCEDPALYTDPGLQPSAHPAAINRQFVVYCQRILQQVKFSQLDMVRFLGQYLSEPKATTYFAAAAPVLTQSAFLRAARAQGIALHAKTRMLYWHEHVFINGQYHPPDRPLAALLKRLADERWLNGREVRASAAQVLFEWYAAGYLLPRTAQPARQGRQTTP